MKTKRALVTGASSGVGKALATLLIRAGYELALVGRNEQKLKELVNGWERQQSERARIVKADLTIPVQFHNVVERCLMAMGGDTPFHLLVNCAGFAVTGRVEDIPASAMEACWNVNYFAPVSLAQQVLPSMRAERSGMIVNVSSGVARRALPYYSPYCSAKAALNSFTESLRVETSEAGITVILFSPGPVDSNFQKSTFHYGPTILHQPPQNGKKSEPIAELLFAAIQTKKQRVTLGTKAALGHHLNYWAPGLTDRIVSRFFKIEEGRPVTKEFRHRRRP
jgi:uncharacterized protein